jgi:hypothetical protein
MLPVLATIQKYRKCLKLSAAIVPSLVVPANRDRRQAKNNIELLDVLHQNNRLVRSFVAA